MHRDLSCLGTKNKSRNAHEVTNIGQLLEDGVVEILVLTGADIITGDIDLYPPFGIHQFNERCFTHDTATHDAPCNGYRTALIVIFEFVFYIRGPGIHVVQRRRIGFYAHFSQFVEALPAYDLLFTQF